MFGYSPYGYGLLSQIPMQQPTQIVQQPLLSAVQGIGSSLPEYRGMTENQYVANLFASGEYKGLLSPIMELVTKKIASGPVITLPESAQQQMNDRIRSMSPEEYERFAIYR